MIAEELAYKDNKIVALRLEHVLRNGKVFEYHDHQRVIKAISAVQTLQVQKYDVNNAETWPVVMREVAKYASDWTGFAACLSTTQSCSKAKKIMFYKVVNDGMLNIKELKKNKDILDLLRGLKVFIFVDNFHHKAMKDAGYLIGLHSKLTN